MNKKFDLGTYEQVLDEWDYYDGLREGLATFKGELCHFYNTWDSSIKDFPKGFTIRLVDNDFLKLSLERKAIYDAWRKKYDLGELEIETHPAGPNVDATYDKLTHELEIALDKFIPLPSKYVPTFRPSKNKGYMQVMWSD